MTGEFEGQNRAKWAEANTGRMQKNNEFVIGLELSIGQKSSGGLSVDEFAKMTEIARIRYGDGVMISPADKDSRMHLSKDKKHLGYIDLKTGSLIWDGTDG